MKALRIAGSVVLLAAVGGIAILDGWGWLSLGLGAALVCYLAVWRNLGKALRTALPILVFALSLVLLQIIFDVPVTNLAGKTVASFFFIAAGVRIYPWAELIAQVPPASFFFAMACYFLFVRHFLGIFTGEALRLLQAHHLCITYPYRRGSFSSLAAALVALFERSLRRAERFYAAQLLRGFAE